MRILLNLIINNLIILILFYNHVNCEEPIKIGKFKFSITGVNLNHFALESNNPLNKYDLEAEFIGSKVTVSNNNIGVNTRFARYYFADNSIAEVTEVLNNDHISHYTLIWDKIVDNKSEVCFNYGNTQQWYSAFEQYHQRWPMNKGENLKSVGFFAHDRNHNHVGGVSEPLWLSTSGYGIYVDRAVPLFIQMHANQSLCLTADYHRLPSPVDGLHNKLIVNIISGKDIKETWKYVAKNWYKKPISIPDQRMFKSPIWSTWAKFHSDITQEKIINFAKEISAHNMPNSQLEIDDKWEIHYGDYHFNAAKFPNASLMIKELHTMGYRVTLWMYPFINTNSDAFKQNEQYFIKQKSNNNKTHIVDWWNGKEASHIDFSNNHAREWFLSRLDKIRKETGVDSFKFDAGELEWMGNNYTFSDSLINRTPSMITQLYVETCSKLGPMIEVRVGFNSQHLPIFVRMLDKGSQWGYDNGLKTLIPTALAFSLAGYYFVLPDMIGGNAYDNSFPSAELFIRWLQVNTLMPTLQFSIVPWQSQYKNDTHIIDITKKMIQLHEHYTPMIIALAEESTRSGDPILRPLWWNDPNDHNTYKIDDEFMIGDNLLVAPVTDDGKRKRDIYLPSGVWRDHHGKDHNGGIMLKDFPVNLEELPYFERKK